MSSPRLIKKYANRRLYDTVKSRHVTLSDIRDLIVSGVDVRIVDDTTDVDITRALLLQVIVEQEQSGDPLLPQVLLTQLIRFYGNPMQHMMGDYLQQSVTTFTAQQSTFQKQMASVLSSGPVDAMQGLMKQNLSAWESMFGKSAPSASGDKSDDRPDTPPGSDTNAGTDAADAAAARTDDDPGAPSGRADQDS